MKGRENEEEERNKSHSLSQILNMIQTNRRQIFEANNEYFYLGTHFMSLVLKNYFVQCSN